MSDLFNMFREGGVWMYLILALGFPAWLFAALTGLAATVKRTPTALGVTGGLTLLTVFAMLALGTAGYFVGMSEVTNALDHAAPEHREAMMAMGSTIAWYPLYFALLAGALPALVGAAGIALGLSARKNGPTPE